MALTKVGLGMAVIAFITLSGCTSPESSYRLGQERLRVGEYQDAVEYFSQAIEGREDYAEAYASRGCAYADLGINDKALADINTAIKLKPSMPGPYLSRGRLLFISGQADKALEAFNHALKIKPDYSDAYLDRAIFYCQLGSLDQALADLDAAITFNDMQDRAYFTRGVIQFRRNRSRAALADFNKAAQLNSKDPRYLIKASQCNLKLRRYEDALTCASNALSVAPNNVEALTAQAQSYFMLGNVDGALGSLNKACQQGDSSSCGELVKYFDTQKLNNDVINQLNQSVERQHANDEIVEKKRMMHEFAAGR